MTYFDSIEGPLNMPSPVFISSQIYIDAYLLYSATCLISVSQVQHKVEPFSTV